MPGLGRSRTNVGKTVEKRHDVGVLSGSSGQEVAESLPPRRRQTAAHVQPERSEPQFSKLVLLNDLAIKELRQRSFEFPERDSQIGAQRIQRRRPAFAEARSIHNSGAERSSLARFAMSA